MAHVGMWHMLRAQRGSYILTLGPNICHISYMDPLGQRG